MAFRREVLLSSARDGDESRDHWRTPLPLYRELERYIGAPFACDVAADSSNHLAPLWFGHDHPEPYRRSALSPHGPRYGPAWESPWYLNPPYSRLAEFLEAANREAQAGGWGVVLCFARTDVEAWWRWVWGRVPDRRPRRGGRKPGHRIPDALCAAETLWIPGRMEFDPPNDRAAASQGNSATAPSVAIVYRPGYCEEWPRNGVLIRP